MEKLKVGQKVWIRPPRRYHEEVLTVVKNVEKKGYL